MLTDAEKSRAIAKGLMDKAENEHDPRELYHLYNNANTWLSRISEQEETLEDYENRQLCVRMMNKYL